MNGPVSETIEQPNLQYFPLSVILQDGNSFISTIDKPCTLLILIIHVIEKYKFSIPNQKRYFVRLSKLKKHAKDSVLRVEAPR